MGSRFYLVNRRIRQTGQVFENLIVMLLRAKFQYFWNDPIPEGSWKVTYDQCGCINPDINNEVETLYLSNSDVMSTPVQDNDENGIPVWKFTVNGVQYESLHSPRKEPVFAKGCEPPSLSETLLAVNSAITGADNALAACGAQIDANAIVSLNNVAFKGTSQAQARNPYQPYQFTLDELVNDMCSTYGTYKKNTPTKAEKAVIKEALKLLPLNRLNNLRGYKFMMLRKGQKFADLGFGKVDETKGGYCDPNRNVIAIKENNLYSFSVLHEIGHAFDFDLFSDLYNSYGHPQFSHKMTMFYNAAKAKKKDHNFITPYSATNEHEYFAESFWAYYIEGWKQSLQANDPYMYKYIRYLMNEWNP